MKKQHEKTVTVQLTSKRLKLAEAAAVSAFLLSAVALCTGLITDSQPGVLLAYSAGVLSGLALGAIKIFRWFNHA